MRAVGRAKLLIPTISLLTATAVIVADVAAAKVPFPELQRSLVEQAASYTHSAVRALASGITVLRHRNERIPESADLAPIPKGLYERLCQVFPVLLPDHDGYGNAILYWSDGKVVILVSRGLDGEFDRDYIGLLKSGMQPVSVFCSAGAEGKVEDDIVSTDEGECRPTP